MYLSLYYAAQQMHNVVHLLGCIINCTRCTVHTLNIILQYRCVGTYALN